MRPSKEFPRFPEGTFELTDIGVCALSRAFEENHDAVLSLKQAIGPERLELFANILQNTNWMTVPPAEEVKIVYGQIAKQELLRLQRNPQPNLPCRHSLAQHQKALETIIEKTKIVGN